MIHGSFDNVNTRGFEGNGERLLRTTKSTIRKLLQKTTWGKIKFMSKLLFCVWSFFLLLFHVVLFQTIAERRSKSAALRAALSKVGARARAALFKKDGSASASGALKKG